MNDSAQLPEIPGYRLVRAIGSGGAATVYEAIQRSLERQVAVKVFNLPDTQTVARFEPLLRANARLSHPHILGAHQIGHTAEGRLFHSMPFMVSAELAAHTLRAKPLRVAALLREVLDAVGHAHRCGIVHGGIKPTNVLFDAYGHTRVADFGIARGAAEIGCPHPFAANYQSPEQARGQAPGQRSDFYSIGVLAYQLLTGSLPFEGEDAVATAVAHIEQPVPRLPPMVGAWQAWIDKALAKSPEQRFQGAQEMADALSAIDGQRGSGMPAPAVARRRVPKRALAAAAALAVVVVALAGWGAWGHQKASSTRAGDAVQPIQPEAAVTRTVPSQDPATADSASLRESRVATLIAQADALRAAGHLFSPRGNNAAEQYFTALTLDPGNPAATAGVDAILYTSTRQLQQAWHEQRLAQVGDLVKRCDLLDAHAGIRARRDWREARDGLAQDVGTAVATAAAARDTQGLAVLKPLAETLPAIYREGFDFAKAERMAATPVAGERLQDRGGPVLVYLPAAGAGAAFAMARVEVTRADYTAFAHATQRPASRCLEAYNPFSRLRHLTWQAPGFAQGGDHPVVCVSWDDAIAYAAWLSRTTGENYRLPTDAEWLRAAQGMPKGTPCQLGNVDDISRQSAMDNDRWSCDDGAAQTAPVGRYAPSGVGAYDMYGNVSEWQAGGSPHAREFRGLSWRDGSHQTPLGRRGTADSDIGYTSVGFRVVRVIDATHPAPGVVSAH
ncbi:MAG: SUMF1/EgtB/PvdO family nonheme iron enzyme [Proteobacteria bacterium]|nr:SUMF1/EgtB/PvdO family nonheme iron enzyme [Pseudomonadota bacterium]